MAYNNQSEAIAAGNIDYITIGIILGAWGLTGALRVFPKTDFPERFARGKEVLIDGQPNIIEKTVWLKKEVAIKIAAIDTPEKALLLRGKELCIPASALRKLPPNQYYQFEIIGLEVYTTNGTMLGRIEQILDCGNDVYVIKRPGLKDILIPATQEVIKQVDISNRKIIIEPIENLLD